MVEKDKTYVCDPCGIEVKIIREGAGTLVCCSEEMYEKEEDSSEQEEQ
jgi:desulfoferrodoxin-like iron-binding protein